MGKLRELKIWILDFIIALFLVVYFIVRENKLLAFILGLIVFLTLTHLVLLYLFNYNLFWEIAKWFLK